MTAQAQQVPNPTTAAQVPAPAPGPWTKAYVQMVGRMAYMWGWPLAVQINQQLLRTRREPAPPDRRRWRADRDGHGRHQGEPADHGRAAGPRVVRAIDGQAQSQQRAEAASGQA